MVLIRSGVLQPRMTQDHTGSNLIAFDANGQFVYGLNNETTEFRSGPAKLNSAISGNSGQ